MQRNAYPPLQEGGGIINGINCIKYHIRFIESKKYKNKF